MKNLRGFTLIELIITMAIAVVLLSIAVPSFTTMLRNNRVTTLANEFITTINLARSEAIRRGTTITVSSTSGNTAWQNGWSMTPAASSTVLRQTAALPSGNTLIASASTSSISFDSLGRASNLSQTASDQDVRTFTLCNSNTTTGREIKILFTGRPTIKSITTCP